jgi:protein-L-isoaspartate(D-aspartate) O-methyltransferase
LPHNPQFNEQKKRVITSLITQGVLHSQDVIRAIRAIPREEFVPEDVKPYSYMDRPLPIGHGQTISAIHMVSIMNEQCKFKVGHKILEIGTGCGYHACTVAEIVAPSNIERSLWGHVYSIDVVYELVKKARENVKRIGYHDRISIIHGDGSVGLLEEAPFDRIYVTAAAPNTPKPLIDQLKIGGILLIPVGGLHLFQSLLKYEKESDGKINQYNLGSVAFVPLRGKYGFK